MPDYVTVPYNGKMIYSGHPCTRQGKAQSLVSPLKKHGWCFLPIPVVDLGSHYQAIDGTHRLEAARRLSLRPEIIVVDARLHPDQPIPKGWEQILEVSTAKGRVLRGFETKKTQQRNHVAVVLDAARGILHVAYVEAMFNILRQLACQIPIIKDARIDAKVQDYLAKSITFSESGELYQSIPGGAVDATRELHERWEVYDITKAHIEGKSVLDIGCNIGGFSSFCYSACKSYQGIDVDNDSIELAKHLYKYSNCTFNTKSVLTEMGTYDVVFAFAVWYYTRLKLPKYAEKLASLLNADGTLFYESHAKHNVIKDCAAFKPFFTIERVIPVAMISTGERKGSRFFAEMRLK